VAALAGLWWWRPWAAAPPAESSAGLRAVALDAGGNLVVVGLDGQRSSLTSDASPRRVYLQLTPAPDGRQVAYIATEPNRALLLVQALDGSPPRTVYASPAKRPFYLAWSPDSRTVAFLASDTVMNLYLVAADGSSPAREIREGQPSYFAWSADSGSLLLHTGGGAPRGSIAQHTLDKAELQVFAEAPGEFQTPGWSEDRAVRYVVVSDGSRNRLVRVAGTEQTDLTPRSVDGLLFSLSPDRSKIAYLTLGSGRGAKIQVIDAAGGDAVELPPVLPLAFFWSPDGTRIATLVAESRGVGPSGADGVYVVAQTAALRIHWEVTTLADLTTRRFAPFAPSDEFLALLPYFDQYATSLALWSPDSSRLIYGATDGVWSLSISDEQTTRLSEGGQGFWIPSAGQR
jgi:Tol biopolymer transport system component